MSLASEMGPKRVFDQSAETIQELIKQSGRGESWVRKFATGRVQDGAWEQVWKRVGKCIAPAYRRKAKR